MKFKALEDDERASIGTQFDLLHALQRRGIGCEAGEIMSFDTHELLRRALITAYTQAPPPGFLAVGFEQIMAADQVIWNQLHRKCRDGIKRRSLAQRPLDAMMPEVLASLPVQMALMPRQGSVQPRAAQEKPELSSKLVNALQKQIDELKKSSKHATAIQGAFAGNASASGGAPAKTGKAQKRKIADGTGPIRPPKGLEGCSTVSSTATESKRMCFSYNMAGCTKAKPGGSCLKGVHLCMKTVNGEACSMSHSQSACTR